MKVYTIKKSHKARVKRLVNNKRWQKYLFEKWMENAVEKQVEE